MAEKTFDECYWFRYDSYSDISLFEVGSFCCPASYGYGPIIRDTHILHYIIRGKGKLVYRDREYTVSANQIFVVPEGDLSYYEADADDPWEYIWIRFHGSLSDTLLHKAGITKQAPVYTPCGSTDKIRRILLHILRNYQKEYSVIGDVYQLFQELIDHSVAAVQQQTGDVSSGYVHQIMLYIDQKYAEPISVHEIADYFGLNRSYLTRIFKSLTQVSPQEYLQERRIEKAKQLLLDTALPINHIAYSVGYNDPFTFSKLFKRKTGLSPSKYRGL